MPTAGLQCAVCNSFTQLCPQVANAMHRGAYTHAFKVVCGFEDASIDEVEHHGMTVCVHMWSSCAWNLASPHQVSPSVSHIL